MNSTVILFLILVTVMYLCIYFLDKYLKIKSQSYTHFIAKHNIQVQFLYITLQTKTFNRMIYKISHLNVSRKCSCLKYTIVYNLGIVCALLSIPASIYIIGQSVYSNLVKPQSSSLYLTDTEEHYINVKPLVIGVNLPMSHLLYYITSLLICIIIHELGHAVCALHENVRLNHVGIILVFIIPVIYVDIENIHTAQVPISLLAKLRIYCAGIWHNVILTLLMYAILYTFPWTISPLYSVNQGVQVTHIEIDSALRSTAGKVGIEPFDVIVRINECHVTNEITYKKCLLSLNTGKMRRDRGYCLTEEFVEKRHETVTAPDRSDCCASNQTKHLCFVQSRSESKASRVKRHVRNNAHRNEKRFEIGKLATYKVTTLPVTLKPHHVEPLVDKSQASLPLPNQELANNMNMIESKSNITANLSHKYCIQARLVLDNSKRPCVDSDQCSPLSHCYSPLTSHTLIQLYLRHKGPYVLYLGSAGDVYNALSVSSYVQVYTASRVLAYAPTIGYNMAVYVSILSSGLALVNAVPCYYFDSQHIVSVLVSKAYVRFCVHALSTLLLGTYFLLFIPSTLFSTPAKR